MTLLLLNNILLMIIIIMLIVIGCFLRILLFNIQHQCYKIEDTLNNLTQKSERGKNEDL